VGSIPYRVIGIFHCLSPSGRTMALGSTQPLTEMSTRNISWEGGGKGGRSVGPETLPPSRADCLETSVSFNLLEPQGSVRYTEVALPLHYPSHLALRLKKR